MTSDPLSGFFIVHQRVLRGVHLCPVGYKILLEILVRGRWQRLVDVPYTFQARYAGVSKATIRQGIQFVRHLASLTLAARFGKRTPPAAVPDYPEEVPPRQVEAGMPWRARLDGSERMEARLSWRSRTDRGEGKR
jgi:hypothetical protein